MKDKPQLYKGEIKELAIGMQMDWRNEMKIHLSDEYLEQLAITREVQSPCHFCGFIDGDYMEAHHLNGDHEDFSESNIVPCCTLCHRVQHIGWVGVKNHGSLVFIPNQITTPSEETAPSVALFNQLQRFYMLREFFGEDLKEAMENIVLFSSLENTVLNNKRIVMTQSYTEYLADKEELKKLEREGAGVNAEDAAVAEKENEVGDKSVATTVSINDEFDDSSTVGINTDGSTDPILNLASGSLLDVVVSLGDIDKEHVGKAEDNPALKFFQEQVDSKHGRFMVLFNSTVFEPFEPYAEYDFYERIRYYLDLEYFDPDKMGSVLEGKLPK